MVCFGNNTSEIDSHWILLNPPIILTFINRISHKTHWKQHSDKTREYYKCLLTVLIWNCLKSTVSTNSTIQLSLLYAFTITLKLYSY